MIIHKNGNLFDSKQTILVNTVNCFGVMGKGLALEFKTRFGSEYFEDYKTKCFNGIIQTGKVDFYLYEEPTTFNKFPVRIIVNFVTKYHWKYPSNLGWIENGLDDFVKKIKTDDFKPYNKGVAFPLLGCSNGKLDPELVIPLMEKKLSPLDMEIEIWRYKDE